ncbi:hypothetical protein SBA4_6540004 [Candidatus Sulfopaludibacter sp. SbA4]|nr:hypothetical protein SBA4_6540004 [Candidatus Sulfopaludibacter sp. SbA4]
MDLAGGPDPELHRDHPVFRAARADAGALLSVRMRDAGGVCLLPAVRLRHGAGMCAMQARHAGRLVALRVLRGEAVRGSGA